MLQTVTLYSLDKKGNALLWSINWDTEDNWYTMSSGRVSGAITTTEKTYCYAKNVGKVNETTDISQCKAEVEARIEKQRKKDFHDEIPKLKRFEVTLAKEFNARKKFIKFPMLVSAKLDGFRCYVTKDGMFSRTHHQVLSCPHIFEELKFIFEQYPNLIIDGELYTHELKDDFNKVASLLSRTKNLDDNFLEETKRLIKLHIFDVVDIENNTVPFKQRFNGTYRLLGINDTTWLSDLGVYQDGDITRNLEYCKFVNQFMVKNFEEVEQRLDKAIEDGFEGIMLRDPNMLYDNGRSSNLIKYKRFKDSEYKVVDIQEGVGNATGLASTIICETKEGKMFATGTGKGWDENAKRELFLNKEKYIGQMVTVKYQELTPDEQVPRFGKIVGFRNIF